MPFLLMLAGYFMAAWFGLLWSLSILWFILWAAKHTFT